MSEAQTVEERLNDLETIARTLIIFSTNTISTLGRSISAGNPELASAIAADLAELKSNQYRNIDKGLYDSYVDSLIVGITGKA
jgi:hypothetical protein